MRVGRGAVLYLQKGDTRAQCLPPAATVTLRACHRFLVSWAQGPGIRIHGTEILSQRLQLRVQGAGLRIVLGTWKLCALLHLI